MKYGSPLISIVIANYNYGRFLDEAVQSVLRQCDEDMRLPTGNVIELIIVDGGSTDNSVEIIKKYAGLLAWWCSEKDSGQSDAFNKGFAHAKGRFLTWLNADDVMFPGSLARVARKIADNPTAEWFVGGCFWLNQDMKVIKCSRARPFSKYRARCGNLSVWGPSSFFSKNLWERSEKVDVSFHYQMDIDLWNRFYFKQRAMYRVVDGYCWGLRLHPNAKMSGHSFASSPLACPNHPAWKQRQRESDQLQERYMFRRMSLLGRFAPLMILYYLLSQYDTRRFSGKLYSDCFGSGVESVLPSKAHV